MVRIFDTEQELLIATADLIEQRSLEAVKTRGRFSLVLSGGKTPDALYRMLSQPEWVHKIPWDKTDVFWGDERYVPADDNRNNSFVAISLLLNKVGISEKQIHRLPTGSTPDKDAADYEHTVAEYFGSDPKEFDLIFLGLGENGHTASLFPHTEVLNEEARIIKEVWVEEVNMYRITMTKNLINQAKTIVFLVQGESKAAVVNDVINGDYQPATLPAQLIRPTSGALYWFLDRQAAAKLPGTR